MYSKTVSTALLSLVIGLVASSALSYPYTDRAGLRKGEDVVVLTGQSSGDKDEEKEQPSLEETVKETEKIETVEEKEEREKHQPEGGGSMRANE